MDPFMPEAFVLDTDGDGMTNKDEFNAGTNPLDPPTGWKCIQSVFTLMVFRLGFR